MQNVAVSGARGLMLARLLIVAAVFAVGGFLWMACTPGLPATARAAAAVGAILCLALPVRVLYVGARRYYHTGTWTLSQEERMAWRQRYASGPRRPWVQPAVTGLLVFMALVSTVSAAIGMRRHGVTPIDGFFFTVWLLFLATQSKQLYKELRKPS